MLKRLVHIATIRLYKVKRVVSLVGHEIVCSCATQTNIFRIVYMAYLKRQFQIPITIKKSQGRERKPDLPLSLPQYCLEWG
jgi:hypothetical protein